MADYLWPPVSVKILESYSKSIIEAIDNFTDQNYTDEID